MGLVTTQHDLYADGPVPDSKVLVARAGTRVDERLLAKHGGRVAERAVPVEDDDAGSVGGDYDGMKAAELKKLAKERGIDGADGLKKAELIDALEYDDERRGK